MVTATASAEQRNGTEQAQGERKQRASRLGWVRIGDMLPHPQAQRDFVPSWANAIAADLKLEGLGFLVVVHVNGVYYVVDGQHRLAAMKLFGFSDDDVLQCEIYEGLTLKQAAQLFLDRNNKKTVHPLSMFKVEVVAEDREAEAINACVRNQGLSIGRAHRRRAELATGQVAAIGTLRTVYRQSGVIGLGKTLRIIRDAYGHAGFEAAVIAGIGLLVHRYDGTLDEDRMVKALSEAAGGLNGLLTHAAKTQAIMQQAKSQCIAATAVSFYNRTPGKKLAPWWKE